MIIYAIKNTVNGKVYVGQTIDKFEKRYTAKKWWKYTANRLLIEDAQKYGHESFVVEILAKASSPHELNDLERYFAEKLNAYSPYGYNLTRCVSRVPTESARKALSEAAKRRWQSKDERDKQAERRRGSTATDETKQKMSKSRQGYRLSDESKQKISAFHSNRPESTRKKISEAHKRRVACSNGQEYPSAKEAAEQLGLQASKICLVCRGKRTHTGGLKFWYITQSS